MKKLMASAAAMGLLAMSAGTAAAACEVGNAEFEKKLMDDPNMRASYASPLVRDVRELRDAAMILKAYGKEDACEEVAEAINDMVENPQELQRSAADGTTIPAWRDKPAEYAYADSRKVTEIGTRLRAEQVIGADVRGKNNETLGEITDVVVDPKGEATYVILSYGGFLGLGEEESAVPFKMLRMSKDRDVFYLPMTEEELERAPRFERGNYKWSSDDAWIKQNEAYFHEFDMKG